MESKTKYISAIALIVIILASAIGVILVWQWKYVIFTVFALSCFYMGFALSSRGAKFTEKRKTYISVITLGLGTTSIIYSIMNSMWFGILAVLVIYFIIPGLGQLLFNLIRRY